MKRWKNGIYVGVIVLIIGIFMVPSLMNFQLPHAETQRLKERKIVRTVIIHAQVNPLDITRFTFDQPVVVSEYFVKKGRSVGQNIPLFRLSTLAGLPQEVNEQAILWEQRESEIRLELDRMDAAAKQSNHRLIDLQEEMDRAEEILNEKQSLFVLGMVAQQDVEQAEADLSIINRNMTIAKEEAALTVTSAQAQRQSLERELKSIQSELEIVNALVSGYYLDEEGNVYSDVSGVVLNKNAENERLAAGDPVLTLAEIDDYQRLEMIGHLSVDDLDVVEVGMSLTIDTDTENRPFHLEITDISSLVENNMVEITMKMTAEPEGKFSIGTSYTGRVERVLSEDQAFSLPYSAIVEEAFDVDQRVTLYYLDQEEGLFVDRYFVRVLRAKVNAIGDQEVLVHIDENDLDPATLQMIVNPGYKIYEDARVLP